MPRTKPPVRRPRYTPEEVIEALQASRGLISLTARRLRCDPQTVRRYLRRYKAIADAREEEREAVTDLAEAALIQAIKEGQAWAVCFYLKCQAKERGYVERPAPEGPQSVTVNIIEAISQARQRALERRQQQALSAGVLWQA